MTNLKDFSRNIAQACIERMRETERASGKKLDEAALHYYAGVCTALNQLGHDFAQPVINQTVLIVAVRGFAGVQYLANPGE